MGREGGWGGRMGRDGEGWGGREGGKELVIQDESILVTESLILISQMISPELTLSLSVCC